jgi:methionyl aminopeptidase
MSITSEADWAGLRAVARVVRLTLERLAAEVHAGITTGELDRIATELVGTHGAQSAPAVVYGFPGTVLISVNDEIVHGIPGRRRLAEGDVVSLDVTLEKDGYVADAARTVIAGAGNAQARRLVRCAESAFREGLRVARAGNRVNEIGRAVEREVRRHGFTVVEGLSGHGVGRTIHEQPDVPNWYDAAQRDVLTEGLVLTIEPMISAGTAKVVKSRDGWTLRTKDGSLASHHEHTLVITGGDPIVLTGEAA